jgi:hypothetical protein
MRAHPWLYNLYMLNPVPAVITAFRAALLEPVLPQSFNKNLANLVPPPTSVPVPPLVYFGAFLITLFIAWSGYAYFNSRKWKFVERG